MSLDVRAVGVGVLAALVVVAVLGMVAMIGSAAVGEVANESITTGENTDRLKTSVTWNASANASTDSVTVDVFNKTDFDADPANATALESKTTDADPGNVTETIFYYDLTEVTNNESYQVIATAEQTVVDNVTISSTAPDGGGGGDGSGLSNGQILAGIVGFALILTALSASDRS